MKRRTRAMVTSVGALAVLLAPAAAYADSCTNVSRPAPSSETMIGTWMWTGSEWMFMVPGGEDSQEMGAPDMNGNFANGSTASILGQTPICTTGVPARQTQHGLQSGCESS